MYSPDLPSLEWPSFENRSFFEGWPEANRYWNNAIDST
jgi:hypothetical protein